jgi:hypothetical protein
LVFDILEKENHTPRNRNLFLISWKVKIILREIEIGFWYLGKGKSYLVRQFALLEFSRYPALACRIEKNIQTVNIGAQFWVPWSSKNGARIDNFLVLETWILVPKSLILVTWNEKYLCPNWYFSVPDTRIWVPIARISVPDNYITKEKSNFERQKLLFGTLEKENQTSRGRKGFLCTLEKKNHASLYWKVLLCLPIMWKSNLIL